MFGKAQPRLHTNSGSSTSALTDAGTVALGTGMPISSIMSMASNPVQRRILSTMANSIRNDMTSTLPNNVANPTKMTASLISENNPLLMNQMMPTPMNSVMSSMSNAMSSLMNPGSLTTNNLMTSSMSSLMTPGAGMSPSARSTPAAPVDTTFRFPSADEILSSAMMEAVGQARLSAYPMSRFFGSSYFWILWKRQ